MWPFKKKVLPKEPEKHRFQVKEYYTSVDLQKRKVTIYTTEKKHYEFEIYGYVSHNYEGYYNRYSLINGECSILISSTDIESNFCYMNPLKPIAAVPLIDNINLHQPQIIIPASNEKDATTIIPTSIVTQISITPLMFWKTEKVKHQVLEKIDV